MASSVVLIQDAGMSASEINFIINSSGLTAEKNIPLLQFSTVLSKVPKHQMERWSKKEKDKKDGHLYQFENFLCHFLMAH